MLRCGNSRVRDGSGILLRGHEQKIEQTARRLRNAQKSNVLRFSGSQHLKVKKNSSCFNKISIFAAQLIKDGNIQ